MCVQNKTTNKTTNLGTNNAMNNAWKESTNKQTFGRGYERTNRVTNRRGLQVNERTNKRESRLCDYCDNKGTHRIVDATEWVTRACTEHLMQATEHAENIRFVMMEKANKQINKPKVIDVTLEGGLLDTLKP